uniref:Uncharacterized protein n=1 Tax=Rhizophora mucronata TaxID=61149 RepID=A0A2P2QAJ6_RHIMU
MIVSGMHDNNETKNNTKFLCKKTKKGPTNETRNISLSLNISQ